VVSLSNREGTDAGKLTHVAADGSLTMVDVGAKTPTERIARAEACVVMSAESAQTLREASGKKGDALVAAQLAGIMAAKHTSSLIPLAHPIALAAVDVAFSWRDERTLVVEATAKTVAATGVEMEAMVGASIAALTIYDMLKAIERGITIESVRLIEKSGGRSGRWTAPA
jgi:cyclic pyranopterin phosphate synthase